MGKFLPWRWAWFGWAVAAAAVALGVPVFLRMPPWCDLTLYDVAARNIMAGGVHYRDVFDTNLPGFVWLLVGVRRLLGPSIEAVRAVDLLIVAAAVWLLAKLARRGGADGPAVAWLAAGAAAFYPFTSEFNHAQRDVWMLPIAAAAVWLRVRRFGAPPTFRAAAVEGAIWAAAVWIKPHALIPAVAVWLATVRAMVAPDPRPWRAAGRDFLGYVVGGLAVGVAGSGWLLATGSWTYLMDVFVKWNNGYMAYVWREWPARWEVQFWYFPPHSLLMPVGVAVAAWDLFGRSRADAGARFAGRALAALFLGWAAQAVVVQRMFSYVHVPEVLLLLAVGAASRRPIAFVAVLYATVCGVAWLAADRHPPLDRYLKAESTVWQDQYVYVPRHPLTQPGRAALWAECLRFGLTDRAYRERMYAAALAPDTFPSIDPVQIGEVADELRRRGAGSGEVLCWHDSPHALYLEWPGAPPLRFMHINTALVGEAQYERMKVELIKALKRDAPRVRFVVSDLLRVYAMASPTQKVGGRAAGPDLLPPNLPADHRAVFPLDRPAVFRSGGGRGRYLIHAQEKPFGPFDNCFIPPWPAE